ncbi:Thioesterase/thiol ester dehydrase-isomerase [Rhizodiscina lignyota]|uniref:Thioesterase/thiol ester dehydrase-isomerase n=1 Tax=Rhizodiscina lignyota TaxID=1504668 RepID=A0A9P4IRM1_9PEZI|nr:Thioesterase/thiol ester dehydrase-isomerase [Rhizodiscina lignyota]
MTTLIPPPPPNPEKAPIENVLSLTQLPDIDPDLFTNTRPMWHPPGARGIYGGAAIAQCLAAAQRTVPSNFTIHSMHCYFVLNGNADIPIIYHVEHVREGRSFATRTVQARQRGKPIFTTTMSFVREGAGGKQLVEHEVKMPFVPGPIETDKDGEATRLPQGIEGPFESQRIDILNNNSPDPHTKKARQWIRARGKISDKGGHQAHLSALAYMSDSYFIGTVARVHKLWRMANPGRARNGKPSIDEDVLKKLLDENDEQTILKKFPELNAEHIKDVKESSASLLKTRTNVAKRPEIGMMVSLDHTIYFHNPRDFRADDWIFTEMDSPWAGDGRGLVMQRMWTKEGKLIATCVQEGVVRLKQEKDSKL